MRNPLTMFREWLDIRTHARRLEVENVALARELAETARRAGDWKQTALGFKEMAGVAIVELTFAKEQLIARDAMLDESERRASALESLARSRGHRPELVA